MLAAVINEPTKNEEQTTAARRWKMSDAALLDEIDELIVRKLADAEAAGTTRAQLLHRAEYYGRMYDLVYARLSGGDIPCTDEPDDFIEQAYEFLAESFWEKIESVYNPDFAIAEEQAKAIINKTRAKLKRLEIALFKGM